MTGPGLSSSRFTTLRVMLLIIQEEENRTEISQTIPNPRTVKECGAVQVQDASEEREEGEISNDSME